MRDKLLPLLPILVSVLSLAIYVATLVPEVEWGDSAELALQAHQLGVTHPTGYPVHSLLGKLFALVVGDPTLGVNLLSAVCTSLAVGLLCLIAWQLTGAWVASALAALTFTVSPFIWERAVVCEVNNVNVCFVALALFLLVRWYQKPTYAMLGAAAAVFGLSLGAYLANLLLLPGFLFLLLRGSQRKLRAIILFIVIVAVLGCLVLSWNVWRSRVLPPVGTEYVPDSPSNLVRYLTGAQYETAALHDARFYAQRIREHAVTFAKNFLGLGVLLGLLGVWVQWTKQRAVCLALLLMFVVDMAYFTGFAVWEYAYLVTPSYLIFALWIAHGMAYLCMSRRRPAVRGVSSAVSAAIVLGLFLWKLPVRWERSKITPVTDFVHWSFEALPEGSVAIGSWGKFAALLYVQQAYSLRPDLAIIERIGATRHYGHGAVENWQEYVRSVLPSMPVFLDRLEDAEASGIPVVRSIENQFSWHQLAMP